jgi:hypothetical protein
MTHQPTLFMRIHKTAGEALAKQISERLPAHEICPEQFEWQVRARSAADLQKFSFFQGHISPSTLSAVFAPLRVFTMLREPKERLLSCFFYWKEGSKFARSAFFDTIAKLSLVDFLGSEELIIRRATWNVQARLLAGGQFGGADPLRHNVYGPWLGESDLACEAVRALERFAFVGITENYQRSLQGAYSLLALGDPPLTQKFNVTSARTANYSDLLQIPQIADLLSQLTHADQIVYEAACRRLERHAPDAHPPRCLAAEPGHRTEVAYAQEQVPVSDRRG